MQKFSEERFFICTACKAPFRGVVFYADITDWRNRILWHKANSRRLPVMPRRQAAAKKAKIYLCPKNLKTLSRGM